VPGRYKDFIKICPPGLVLLARSAWLI